MTSVIGSPYINKWNQEDYSKVLEVGLEAWVRRGIIEKIDFVPPGRVCSWMKDSSGDILILDKGECVTNEC